ncbi:MAG: VWA domain-containing protein [Bacteroidales bacterium]|nr:VWA domain-containing protein [Bacteroidales bacterium]MCF8333588.1 VWA domain-containing protein [Bacteroidales bacterium]
MMRFLKASAVLFLLGFLFVSCAKDNNSTPNQPGYKLIEYGEISENTQKPSFINIMFQVTDMQGNGVSSLSTEDFEVLENGDPVSPTESAMQIRKQGSIPYTLKTVLLIDNSFSVGDKLPEIKNAAKSLVLNKLDNQEIAVFVFSENPVLLQDFTDNTPDLVQTIEDIELGNPTTNLYGSIAEAVSMWEDYYQNDDIQQGFLVTFTDGSDTQGSSTLQEALQARGQKNAYMVGLGDEIEPDVLKQLGNAGFYSIDNVSELAEKFEEIQNDMAEFANSFYWMNYMTPKRGDNDHTLKLYIENNANTGEDSYIEGTFNSKGFTSVNQGLYVNTTETNPYGIDQIDMAAGDTTTLDAITYLGSNAPEYSWQTSDNTVIKLTETYDPGNYNIKAFAAGQQGQSAEVTVNDYANGMEKTITINIVESSGTTEGLVAHYNFTEGSMEDAWGSFDANNYGATPTEDINGNAEEAMYFEPNAYISTSQSPVSTGPKTITFRMKSEEHDRRQILVANSLDSESSDDGFLIAKKADNTLEFFIGNGQEEGHYLSASTSFTLGDNNWHTVTMVYDGNKLKGYIDNTLRTSASSVTGSETAPTLGMQMGGPFQPVNTFFKGKLDEVKLFERALSEQEITELYE